MSASTTSDDFYLVDDEGNAIPANAEASALVTAEYGDELQIHDTDEWYLEGMRECEGLRERLEGLTFDFASDDDEDDDGHDEGDHTTRDAATAQDEPNVEDDEADEGMEGAPTYSREYSDGDEWVLEELLARRVPKKKGAPTHARAEYDVDGKPMDVPAPHEYECKWRWYRETTWESRATLEDMGYLPQLDMFDAARVARRRTRNARPSGKRIRKLPDGELESLLGPDFKERVRKTLLASGLHCRRYATVNNTTCETNFVKAWQKHSQSHCPMIVFHGTDSKNLDSIASRGLLVPNAGSGIHVSNGNLYGVGIYAAKNASYSCSYTKGDNRMFVCVALVGPQYTTMKEVRDICVFMQADHIVPLWLIEFEQAAPPPANIPSSDMMFRLELKKLIHRQYVSLGYQYRGPISTCSGGERAPPITKRMMKRMPRTIKSLYKDGTLKARKTS